MDIRDGHGQLPLHVTIQAKAPSSVLEVLLLINLAAAEAGFYCHDDVMLNFPPVLMDAVSD